MNTTPQDLPQDGSIKRFSLAKTAKTLAAAILFLVTWLAVLNFTAQTISHRLWSQIPWPAAILVLFIPLAALCAIILNRRWYFLLIIAAGLGFLLFFPVTIYTLLAIPVMILGFWFTYLRAEFEMANNVRFAPQHIVRKASHILLLTFMLVVAFFVYETVARDLATDRSSFYNRLAVQVTHRVLPLVEKQLVGFESADSLDQFIVRGFAESQPEFATLPESLKIEQIANSRQRILEQLGIEAKGSEPLSDIAVRAIEYQMSSLLEPYSAFLPLIYGLVIFSLLRIVSIILEWLAKAWGYFLFWLLRRTKYLKITTTQITAEHVEI